MRKRMAIRINIDVMLAKRKMSVTELSEKVGITMANISILKNGKAKKITVFTYKPKKGEKRKMGHRQPYTKIQIESVQG